MRAARVSRATASAVAVALGFGLVQATMAAPGGVLKTPNGPVGAPEPESGDVDPTSWSVSSKTGAFEYAHPIAVPPGRRGLQPDLALTYSSQAAIYGTVAAGWSLDVPMIRVDTSEGRQHSDYGYRANENRRYFTSTLAGNARLVPVSEPAGAGVVATYRAQHDATYARYERMDESAGFEWQARMPDGTVYQFGHADHVTGVPGQAASPLTRVVDEFGNRVEYYWLGGTDYALQAVEYTLNEAAGITEPHARVELSYAAAPRCEGGTMPIGAELDYRSGSRRYLGALELRGIHTFAARDGGGLLRKVRDVELVYDPEASRCDDRHGPQRRLASIRETAYSERWSPGDDDEAVVLPEVVFTYGPMTRELSDTRLLAWPAHAEDEPFGLEWGRRNYNRYMWPTVEQMLLDIDGDGFADRVYAAEREGGAFDRCALEYDRGTPDGFVSDPGNRVVLPTLPWEGGGEPSWRESCSLSAQRVYLTSSNPTPSCGEMGSYFVYRFLDMDGDDRLELVAALHYDNRRFTPWELGAIPGLGLPEPSCTPSAGACPDLPDDCGGAPVTCEQGTHGASCQVDELAIQACVANAPTAPCDAVLYSAWDPEDEGDDDWTGIEDELDQCELSGTCTVEEEEEPPAGCGEWRGCFPDTERGTWEDGSYVPICDQRIVPHEKCGSYVWYVYGNRGDGSFASDPEIVLAPVPLAANTGDGYLGTGRIGTTTEDSGVADLNGDGYLDAFAREIPSEPMMDASPGWWYVWFGDGRGRFLPDESGHPYVWMVPAWANSTKLLTASGVEDATGDVVRVMAERETLLDVNGDGLPDLLRFDDSSDQIAVYYNNGLGFLEPDLSWSWLSEVAPIPTITTTFIDLFAREQFSEFVSQGKRVTVSAPIDRDSDGRPDFFLPVPAGSAGFADHLIMNDGSQMAGTPLLLTDQEDGGLRERVTVDRETWRMTNAFTDLTGDGRPDMATMIWDGTGTRWLRVNTEPDDGIPARALVGVDNGRGGRIAVRYAPHTDPEVVTQDIAAAKTLATPTWVVESVELDSTWNPAGTATYRYDNPVVNRDWLGHTGFRGFERVETTSPLGTVTVESFDYDVDYTGRLAEVSVYEREEDVVGSDGTYESGSPVSVTTVHTRAFELFGGALVTFHESGSTESICGRNKRKDNCLEDDEQITYVRTWAAQPSSSPVLYAERATSEYVGRIPFVNGAPALGGHPRTPDDRATLRIFTLDSDEERYRLRVNAEWTIELATYSQTGYALFDYDPSGRVVIRERHRQGDGRWATTQRGWDMDTGNLERELRPEQYDRGVVAFTTYEYDPFALHVTATVNPLGHRVETDRDYATGIVTEMRGPNVVDAGGADEAWATVRTVLDGLGRAVETWVSRDTSSGSYELVQVTRRQYHEGTPSSRASVTTESRIDWGDTWSSVTIESDGLDRVFRQVTVTGDGTPDAIETFRRDAEGNVVEAELPDPRTDDGATVLYTTAFDAIGRPIAARNPDGTGVDFAYDGLVTTRTEYVDDKYEDPRAPTGYTIVLSDVFGRIVGVDERIATHHYARTTYDWDTRDRLVTSVDAEGFLTEIEYDMRGNRTAIHRGEQTWRYQYDLNGNVVAEIAPHPAGAEALLYTNTIAYDELDRVTSRLVGNRTLTPDQRERYGIGLVEYHYDTCEDESCTEAGGFDPTRNLIGRLRAIEMHPWGAVRYAYDSRGNQVLESQSFELPDSVGGLSDQRSIVRAFTPQRRLANQLYADGRWSPGGVLESSMSAIEYDVRGDPKRLWLYRPATGFAEVASDERGVAGKLRSRTAGVHTRTFDYDALGRPVLDVLERPQGTDVLEAIEYYASGEVATRTNLFRHVYDYEYDQRKQLTRASYVNGRGTLLVTDLGFTDAGRLEYAEVGGIGASGAIRPRHVEYEYVDPSANPQQVDILRDYGDGSEYASFEYDSEGSVVERTIAGEGTWQLVYDGERNLRELVHPDGSSEIYYYTPDGMRMLALREGSSEETVLRLWLDGAEVHYDGAGEQIKSYAHLALEGQVARVEDRDSFEYTFHNSLGHLLATTEADGDLAVAFAYAPFGEILEVVGDAKSHRRRFNGKETDPASGVSYYGHRYYDPVSMTWLSADPKFRFSPDIALDAPRRHNLYVFSLQNPLRYVDPDGLDGNSAGATGSTPKVEPEADVSATLYEDSWTADGSYPDWVTPPTVSAQAGVGYGKDGFFAGIEAMAQVYNIELAQLSVGGVKGSVNHNGPRLSVGLGGSAKKGWGAGFGISAGGVEGDTYTCFFGVCAGVHGSAQLGVEFTLRAGAKTELGFGPFKGGVKFFREPVSWLTRLWIFAALVHTGNEANIETTKLRDDLTRLSHQVACTYTPAACPPQPEASPPPQQSGDSDQ